MCIRDSIYIDMVEADAARCNIPNSSIVQRAKHVRIQRALVDDDDSLGAVSYTHLIGHVRPDQLFYAACRGLSQEQTEALFLSAKLEDAALQARCV